MDAIQKPIVLVPFSVEAPAAGQYWLGRLGVHIYWDPRPDSSLVIAGVQVHQWNVRRALRRAWIQISNMLYNYPSPTRHCFSPKPLLSLDCNCISLPCRCFVHGGSKVQTTCQLRLSGALDRDEAQVFSGSLEFLRGAQPLSRCLRLMPRRERQSHREPACGRAILPLT